MSSPKISVVLGSYNRKPFLRTTIESIRDNGWNGPLEVIVVDGGSDDGSVEWLVKQQDVVTIVQHNRGSFRGRAIERRSWGYFMNLGFRATEGRYVLMVSDDCLLVPGAITNGVAQFEAALADGRPLGGLAFYWRNWPEERHYSVGLTLGGRMFVNHGLFLRDALDAVGWIDEERYRFYHADGDLSLKLWDAGYEIEDCSTAFVEHFSHANLAVRASNLEQQKQDWHAYVERWEGTFDLIEADPPWRTRHYVDPHRTADRFPRGERLRLRARTSRAAGLSRAIVARGQAMRAARRERRRLSPTAWRVIEDRLTYLTPTKMERIERALAELDRDRVPGGLLETGVALGGSAIVIAQHAGDREFDGYDVFGLIPPPGQEDTEDVHARYAEIASGTSDGIGGDDYYGYRTDLYDEVVAVFERYGLPLNERRRLHQGLFEDTLHPTGPVAFAHIDCDWHDPVLLCLQRIYPHLSPGGYLVLDDYFHYGGARKAVDTFLAEHPMTVEDANTEHLVLRRPAP
jgi:predicted O-methyltransferase YrrM